MLLDVKDLTVHYGKALAVEAVSIEVREGKIAIIVGSNGAGKTTILKVISGLIPLTSGAVTFGGTRIDGMKAFSIVRMGLVHVPEGRRLFPDLTVYENLSLGATARKDNAGIKETLERVYTNFPILIKRREQKAGSLSGGEQQMLAIGRALMADPKLLMLDEPCLGLAPLIIDHLGAIIRTINNSGVTVLLVEQNVSLALKLGDYGYVLEVGTVTLRGGIDDLRGNETIQRAYLGD